MTKGPQQEIRTGLEGRDLLGFRVGRRALLRLLFPRAAASAGEVVPADEASRPARCGACGGYHVLNVGCPVEADQRALAREFRIGYKAESPRLESETGEEERGS